MAKKSSDKGSSHKHAKDSFSAGRVETKLLENMIALQKIETDLAQKFEKLADQISNLLALFEITARTFAEQPHIKESERDKEFLEKIDRLLEQNKTLARGLTLMEQNLREKIYGPIHPGLHSLPKKLLP